MSPKRKTRKRKTRSRARDLVVPVDEIVGNAAVRRMCSTTKTPITRHTLIRWRETEEFPQPIRVTDGVELWDAREVRDWLRARDRDRD